MKSVVPCCRHYASSFLHSLRELLSLVNTELSLCFTVGCFQPKEVESKEAQQDAHEENRYFSGKHLYVFVFIL